MDNTTQTLLVLVVVVTAGQEGHSAFSVGFVEQPNESVGHKERPQVPERGEAVLILLRDGLNIGTTERFPVKHGSQVMKCRDKSTS